MSLRKESYYQRQDSQWKIVREGEQVKIGSNKDYIALCRKCYMNDKLDKEDIHLENGMKTLKTFR